MFLNFKLSSLLEVEQVYFRFLVALSMYHLILFSLMEQQLGSQQPLAQAHYY
jgi:hypothetical protein